MIFGHYSIPVRTLQPSELPAQLNPGTGNKIQYTVRVAHIMFIPIFPFSKSWTLKKDGDHYKMSPEGVKVLDALFGKRRMPWYAFAGPILIAAFMIFGKIGSAFNGYSQAADFEDNITAIQEKIANPSTDDYYSMKEEGYTKVYKVVAFTQDSIEFSMPTKNDRSRWSDRGRKVMFFENPAAPVAPKTIAKTDLESAIAPDYDTRYSFKGIPLVGAADGRMVELKSIDRVARSFVEKELAENMASEEVRQAFTQYMDGYSLDTAMIMMDEASTQYFTEMLAIAKTDDFTKMKQFIERSDYPLVTYKYMIHTKYTYLSSFKNKDDQEAVKPEEEMTSYLFFMKLVEQGLWTFTLEEEIKAAMKIGAVHFTGENRAFVSVVASSNILSESTIIPFRVKLNKEEGIWKVNVPSTFAYTSNQIEEAAPNSELKKKYRFQVVEEVEQLESVNAVDVEWFY